MVWLVVTRLSEGRRDKHFIYVKENRAQQVLMYDIYIYVRNVINERVLPLTVVIFDL